MIDSIHLESLGNAGSRAGSDSRESRPADSNALAFDARCQARLAMDLKIMEKEDFTCITGSVFLVAELRPLIR